MQSNDIFSQIGRVLSAEESAQALTALRQDPLVWQGLEQAAGLQAALECLDGQVPSWNPARLALLALGPGPDGPGCPFETLRAEPLAALGQAVQERALQAYQVAQNTGKSPSNLREAGLLALALRERRRLTGTWSGLLAEILPKPGQSDTGPGTAFAVWRTPLACLYGMIPDPEEMLRSLLPRTAQPIPCAMIAHVQLSQPFSEEEHVSAFARLLHGLPAPLQLCLLRALNLHGRERIAAELSSSLVVGHPAFASLRAQNGVNEPDLAGLSQRALSLQQMGSFYQLSGERAQALSLFNAAEVTLKNWLAGLYLQRLNLQVGDGASDTGPLMESSQAAHLASAAGWLKNELGVVLLSHPYAGMVMDQVPFDVDSAFLQLKRARQMVQNEPAVARDLAHQCAAGLLETVTSSGLPFIGDFVYTWCPEDALKILLELDLLEDAARLARALLVVRPADVSLLQHASRIQERMGNLDQAIHYARGVAALHPGSSAGHRLLGSLWGQAGAWEQALVEWQLVLDLSSPSSVPDRLACAQVALNAGRIDLAVTLSEAILGEDANNGAALGIFGQALVAQGDAARATSYLVRATLLSPENLSPWLALARLQSEQGDSRRALETLRSAVTAVPDAPEGHLALGEACAEAGLLAESLPHLKKAYTLSQESARCALLYGRTLRVLGHTNEARGVLEKSRVCWNSIPELAYEYAQVLLDLNDAESALPVLEMALRSGLPVLDASLLYARILLGEFRTGDEEWDAETMDARLQQAGQALQRILAIAPDNLEARFLMADILRERGQLEAALDAYRALAEMPAVESPELRWRVQWGMGCTALLLERIDMALVALKEAAHENPESIPVLRSLAEASLRANLLQEALECAANVLRLAPDDVEALSWFADFVTRAGDPRRAVEALDRAVQLNPERPDLLVNLASGQASAGDLTDARVTLEKLLSLPVPATRADLRRAAHIYLRVEDPQSALACYARALLADAQPPSALLFEVANLHERMGNYEAALDLVQQALGDGAERLPGVERLPGPESLPIHLLQADLLIHLDRPQAALAVLERALRIAQSVPVGVGGEEPAAVRRMLGEIHDRFTRLMIQSGDLPAALHHAEKSLACAPASAALCYRAADLALAQLQNDRAARIVQSFEPGQGEFPAVLFNQGRAGLDLLSLQVEMALHGESIEPAGGWVEAGLQEAPGDPRLLAAKARLLARQGDRAGARQQYAGARRQMGSDCTLWLAEAALEVQAWQDVPDLFERCALHQAGEARAHLALARALVLCAERQQLCAATGCRGNAPGAGALGEESHQKFEAAIRLAGRLVNTAEISRWQARGQAIFAPSAQAARALASMPSHPEDVAALVAVLRQLNNRGAAIQVSRRYAAHPLVLLQLALCYLGDPSPEGLVVAERAVSTGPDQPLSHAVLAMLNRQVGELTAALASYEGALNIWTDEHCWHDAAGDLCVQVGDVAAGLAHFQQALALDPDNSRYAFKLGQACLSEEDITGAISCLERSTAIDPAQADAWLTLATAYHMAERLPQALEAARKAGELNASSADALLVAGETALSMNLSDQALEFAQGAVRREPENAGAVLFLSNVLVLRGRVEDGLAVIEQASPAVKTFFPVAFERAKLIHRLHGAQASADVLEKLVKDYPEEPDLLGFLARTQAECGEVKAAERYAFRALRLDPNQPDLTLMLGRLSRKNGNLDQAVHMLSEAIRMAPESLEAYLEMGSVYQERREFSLALQTYQQAMRIAPNDYQAFYQCGLILRDSKDYMNAESMLRRAAELVPDNAGQVALSIRRQLVAVIALNLVHHKQEVMIS
jgi:tetratricopeptide (TPR) repeat protein